MDGRNQVNETPKISFFILYDNVQHTSYIFIVGRTIDTVIIGYAKQTLPFFIGDLDLILDVVSLKKKQPMGLDKKYYINNQPSCGPIGWFEQIPGDMVVNAMMVAMVAHSDHKKAHMIYHVTSSMRNPALNALVVDTMHHYFFNNPQCQGRNGEHVRLKKMQFFKTVPLLRLYMVVKYELPLKVSLPFQHVRVCR
jgi:fatty acyl-CoA reductase